jgi:hypothetical protein
LALEHELQVLEREVIFDRAEIELRLRGRVHVAGQRYAL